MIDQNWKRPISIATSIGQLQFLDLDFSQANPSPVNWIREGSWVAAPQQDRVLQLYNMLFAASQQGREFQLYAALIAIDMVRKGEKTGIAWTTWPGV